MEGDPFVLIEGMTIAGIAVGATKGYIYIRSEYPHAVATLSAAIAIARARRHVGPRCRRLAASVRSRGARRRRAPIFAARKPRCWRASKANAGMVRAKPPLPAIEGLFGKPTVINNVISLASVPIILAEGAAALSRFRHGPFARHDADPARGQRPSMAGLFETAFGLTLRRPC